MKSKKGREHGRDPRVWALVVFAVGLVLYLIIVATLLQPQPLGSDYAGMGFVIFQIFHECQNSISGTLDAIWLGWVSSKILFP